MTLVSTFARADALIDPMRPPLTARSEQRAVVTGEPQVSAIFFSGQRRIAVFDGRVVKVGDRIGEIVIQAINVDGVQYARAGRTLFARLPKQAATVRRSAAGLEEGQ